MVVQNITKGKYLGSYALGELHVLETVDMVAKKTVEEWEAFLEKAIKLEGEVKYIPMDLDPEVGCICKNENIAVYLDITPDDYGTVQSTVVLCVRFGDYEVIYEDFNCCIDDYNDYSDLVEAIMQNEWNEDVNILACMFDEIKRNSTVEEADRYVIKEY